MNNVITRAPWTWRLVRGPMTGFFERAAPTWDQRFASDPERLVPLNVALDLLPTPPARVLDVGTGTGVAALIAAERWPKAEVTGVDMSPAMIAQAAAKESRAGVDFRVADLAELDPGAGYDLVIMLNMPPFFAPVSALLRPGGFVVHIASRGATTPFYTPAKKLRQGFEGQGLATFTSGTAGPGTYYVARRQ